MTIRGQVYSQGETQITGAPRVAITVANIQEPDRFLNLEFLVDTGFTGYLTLPPESIGQLGLPKLGEVQVVLANGVESRFETYAGSASWLGQSRRVPIIENDSEPLLGMAFVWGSRLTVEGWDGGIVSIEEVNHIT